MCNNKKVGEKRERKNTHMIFCCCFNNTTNKKKLRRREKNIVQVRCKLHTESEKEIAKEKQLRYVILPGMALKNYSEPSRSVE